MADPMISGSFGDEMNILRTDTPAGVEMNSDDERQYPPSIVTSPIGLSSTVSNCLTVLSSDNESCEDIDSPVRCMTDEQHDELINSKVDFRYVYETSTQHDRNDHKTDIEFIESDALPPVNSESEYETDDSLPLNGHAHSIHDAPLSTVEIELNIHDTVPSLESEIVIDDALYTDHNSEEPIRDDSADETDQNQDFEIDQSKARSSCELTDILDIVEQSYVPKVEYRIRSNKYNRKVIENGTKILMRKVAKRTEELKGLIDAIQDKFSSDIQKTQQKSSDEISVKNDELMNVMERLKQILRLKSCCLSAIHTHEIIQAIRCIKRTLENVDTKLNNGSDIRNLQFLKSKNQDLTQKTLAKAFGRIVAKEQMVHEPKPDEEILEVITSFKYATNAIWSLTYNPNGSIWIGTHEETTISLVTGHGVVLRSIGLGQKVYDTTMKQDGNLLMTIVHDSHVHELSPNREVTSFIEFKNLLPCGIHAGKSGHIYVGLIDGGPFDVHEGSKRSVVRLTNLGSIVQRVERDENGERIFTLPYRIYENFNNDICVVDWLGPTAGRLVIINEAGKLKHIYTGFNAKKSRSGGFRPGGLTCSSTGKILVCDISNDVIHLLNSEGRCLRLLGSNRVGGLYGPCDISMNNEDEIWVGSCKGDIQHLKMSVY